MLYLIGPLAVQVYPFNMSEIRENGSTDFATKGVVGAKQPLEFVGEGSDEIELSGTLFPQAMGGLDSLELLRQLRMSGKPQFVMRGDGTPLGYYAIVSSSASSSYLDNRGVGKKIDVSISLRGAQKPSAFSFFSLAIGLIENAL